jgi:hypothetical protein
VSSQQREEQAEEISDEESSAEESSPGEEGGSTANVTALVVVDATPGAPGDAINSTQRSSEQLIDTASSVVHRDAADASSDTSGILPTDSPANTDADTSSSTGPAAADEAFTTSGQPHESVPVFQLGGSLSMGPGTGVEPQPLAVDGVDDFGVVHAAFLPSSEEQAVLSDSVTSNDDAMSVVTITQLESAVEQLRVPVGGSRRLLRAF